MRSAVVGGILLAIGAVGMLLGVLTPEAALAIADRVWPILLFVIAVTLVAELAATAGVFDTVAAWLARLSRGRTAVLWGFSVLLAILSTVFLSLDTTAVLLTPVVVAVARAHRLDPLPFAFATVWLANTASLVLPVSNLTNLLAVDRLGTHDPLSFIALLGPSAAVAIIVTVVALLVAFRRGVRGRFSPAPPPHVADRTLLVVSGVVVVILLPALVSGLEPWIPASIAAAALAVLYAWRSPRTLRFRLVPWQLVVFASGLFVAIGLAESLGSASVLQIVAGDGESPLALGQLAGVGMIGANTLNNLPAYLALESSADSPLRLAALLIGVNAGPLITPWASLATLLWRERLRALGVDVSWRRFVLWGLVVAPTTVAASVVPLALR